MIIYYSLVIPVCYSQLMCGGDRCDGEMTLLSNYIRLFHSGRRDLGDVGDVVVEILLLP